MTKTAHVRLDLDDVRRAGDVSAAILAWARDSDTTSSGVIGSSFSTSGPGSGWSMNHDATDYAARALDEGYGAMYYLDKDDGRLASIDEDGDVVWSDESVVQMICPSIEDTLDHPAIVAEMAMAVITHHGPLSDRKEWADLIRSIRDAAEALEDVDLDDLAGE